MRATPDRAAELAALDAKINALLPPRYQHCYGSVRTGSMGSAPLTFGPDGLVAWDRIWTTFCDLALAGGPPHRGTLLEPVDPKSVAAEPARYRTIADEIARAFALVTGLPVLTDEPGWVGVRCESADMAAWLLAAVTAENVTARRRGDCLDLPAGPRFVLGKEVKNVVVALAKTCHYWSGHMPDEWVARPDPPEPIGPPAAPVADRAALVAPIAAAGWPTESKRYAGWVGLECADEDAAVWLLRAVAVADVLVRREGATVYVPTGATPAEAERVAGVLTNARDLWAAR
ncbi:hypothetical protein [Urbifossiella limnaea]|uniref:Uncharacterized protein n=1 Tax=Urbifossiella limnaea TaxID=2528023 RepID=A0A517XLJ7_9BACT|nr:hypothetical protein [Urbifossiella limnaea]QDU18382.1 hypothetical protein ETAA1_02680 [Urbifossiella limnaea]